jgi:tetrahydromethanopterin S-methyltransferase subunit G
MTLELDWNCGKVATLIRRRDQQMASDVTRDEFKHLEARVDVIEREVDGEKLVTRHVLEQTRRNSDDLAAIKSRLDRMERKNDGRFDAIEGKVDGLIKNLPQIVGEVMREVMRERDGKK